MFKRTFISATIVALCSAVTVTWAAEQQVQQNGPAPQQTRPRDQIYGSQLMTRQERIEHRARMRAAKTLEEREQVRADHHARMQERAKERGVKLPDAPPPAGARKGMGPGPRP